MSTRATATSEAPMMPLLGRRRPLENDDDGDALSTPPASPSQPGPAGCCSFFVDESPRPGELEAIRSFSEAKKKTSKAKTSKAKRRKQLPPSDSLPLALPVPPPPPATPRQNKKKTKKKRNPAPPTTAPSDARLSLAAERERHGSFDPRLPAPGWHPPPSPLSLLEEALYSDPWRLLVACCLLNKTTAGVARPCLRRFFSRYPDAAAAAAIETEGGGSEELEALAALFRPCGCHRRRAAAVARLSREFLRPSWRDPRELFGVGEYAADAYWIFVRGIWHCGARGEEEEQEEEERGERRRSEGRGARGEERGEEERGERSEAGDGGGGGGEKAKKAQGSPRSRSSPSSFSWRPKDKDLAKYVDFLVETSGQGCGLEREEF